MSSESLSQNEIDLLFSGGGGAATETQENQPARTSTDVQIYDFRRPARISKDRKRSLMAIYGLLTKSLEGWLTGRVRDSISLELQSVEQLSFGEFMLALPSPCASYIVDVGGGVGQQGVIDFGHEFAYFIVDRFLGGNGRTALPERPLTPLERLVVRICAERVAAQMSDAWKDYVKMELHIGGFESIPEMLQVANREDPVLVANVEVLMGDMSSTLLLCLPFSVLEKFFTGTTNRRVHTAQGTPEERHTDRRNLERVLRESRVEVGARLPVFRVPLGMLAGLKPGGVLATGVSAQSTLEVLVAGQHRFGAAPGRMGQHLAVQILEETTPPPDPSCLLNPREVDP